ncbi:hypothetical protein [Clostridium septicum]|uniref:Uncharacterized protein n=1 Tax=Clostridium septicum TaxID=1504 RepID=A0A9N7JKJ0_CLOSE|nr:hypothetical protein [Clostridium septicum]AYE34244.1 hypothetical protein CP523_07150 [Clostridium septicum]MDU1313273.1 hypothetical protein [Clostridium septicum]QAS59650.1 hypothetical protein EI377_01905 [Clostridium septicum]UEC21121.1 hypothetical protein LK444_01605 [Clostridium septicum]USS00830.1 hypothetical protein NH397_15490 [Clostridium septicum]
MPKKTSKNNDLLNSVKRTTAPKIYSLLVELVNDEREDLAEMVLKIDYLLKYTSNCINHKDFEEAKESLQRAEERIKLLKEEHIDIDYLQYLYDGIKKKCK